MRAPRHLLEAIVALRRGGKVELEFVGQGPEEERLSGNQQEEVAGLLDLAIISEGQEAVGT